MSGNPLILLNGPSSAGKSTIAGDLRIDSEETSPAAAAESVLEALRAILPAHSPEVLP